MLLQIDRNPSRRQLRVFSACWLVFFAGFGLWLIGVGRARWLALLLCGCSVVAPIWLVLAPRTVRWLYVGLSYVTWPISVLISFLVVFVLYYGVVTPIGLAMRLVRYDPMKRKWEPERQTYWESKAQPPGIRNYLRQF